MMVPNANNTNAKPWAGCGRIDPVRRLHHRPHPLGGVVHCPQTYLFAGDLTIFVTNIYGEIGIAMEKYGPAGEILQGVTISPEEFLWLTGGGGNTPNEGVFGRIECSPCVGGGWRVSRKYTPHGSELFVDISFLTYHKLFSKRVVINGQTSFAKTWRPPLQRQFGVPYGGVHEVTGNHQILDHPWVVLPHDQHRYPPPSLARGGQGKDGEEGEVDVTNRHPPQERVGEKNNDNHIPLLPTPTHQRRQEQDQNNLPSLFLGDLTVTVKVFFKEVWVSMEKFGVRGKVLQSVTINPGEFFWLTGSETSFPNEGEFGRIKCSRNSEGWWRVSREDANSRNNRFVDISLMTFHKLFSKREVIRGKIFIANGLVPPEGRV